MQIDLKLHWKYRGELTRNMAESRENHYQVSRLVDKNMLKSFRSKIQDSRHDPILKMYFELQNDPFLIKSSSYCSFNTCILERFGIAAFISPETKFNSTSYITLYKAVYCSSLMLCMRACMRRWYDDTATQPLCRHLNWMNLPDMMSIYLRIYKMRIYSK